MITQAIRRNFLKYFKDRGHLIVPSSSVVPHDDPTLLFTNAGMNQFKDVFLGKSTRDYACAATSQKCIRVGGKHNDLDNVGHTSRHLTFFEMLGNFSFGDYFKIEAIKFAWEVSTEVFGLDANRIWPTVYRDDDEAFELWTHYVPAEKITRFGEKENFWAMGDVGPCGPCSELLYDRGPHFGHASKPAEDLSGERYLEFWNLVFMQYNRLSSGQQEVLPRPSIDTGAGLERVVSLRMGVESLFETDVLRSLIARTEEISNQTYVINDIKAPAFCVIADHLRSLSFAIADGAQPGNVDRGYVLRKILRRAVRYGRQLGMDQPFLAQILPQLVGTMGGDYPELQKSQHRIAEILTLEEESFIRTLKRGGNLLSQVIERSQASNHLISGDDIFKLKDTYGMPFDEIALIAKDANLNLDQDRFMQLEEEARQRSKNVHKTTHQLAEETIFAEFVKEHGPTKFLGYSENENVGVILGLVKDGQFVDSLSEGEEGFVILSQTPFYAEMGGQIGDSGSLKGENSYFNVKDCLHLYKGLIAHQGVVEAGMLQVASSVIASIDKVKRQKIANNHTATHLLHWALYEVLGQHIKQAGSVVDAARLRFDFSHHKPLSVEEIRQIEDLVNQKIRENNQVEAFEIGYEEAQKHKDIKQFFGEKYGSLVRVIKISDLKELCGGTHTTASGTIGIFKIAKESSIAAGVRRIEGVTGEAAELLDREREDQLSEVAELLKAPVHLVNDRLKKLLEENKYLSQLQKEVKADQLKAQLKALDQHIKKIANIPVVMAKVSTSAEELKQAVEVVSDLFNPSLIILATDALDKCQVIVSVSDDGVKKGISAQEIIKLMMPLLGGSGGGKQQLAQGAGKNSEMLPQAFEQIEKYLNKIQL